MLEKNKQTISGINNSTVQQAQGNLTISYWQVRPQ